MSIRKSRNKPPASSTEACAPIECGQMFGIIAEGLDDLKSEVSEARKDINAVNERIASQEAKTHSAWHSISRIETRVNRLPKDNAESIARHEASCPGRDYARLKLASSSSSSSIPKPNINDGPGNIPTPQFSMAVGNNLFGGFQVPRWVVYLGVGIGAAILFCGYVLLQLDIFKL